MSPTDLKSLLHSYLALLRSPGGAEKIGFALLQHIDHLTWREAYGGPITLRDLPAYRESAPRGGQRDTEQSRAGVDAVLPSDRD